MTDQNSESNRLTDVPRADAATVIRPAGPSRGRQAARSSFADRLGHSGMINPSMLRYPGPRDYCGFEAPGIGSRARARARCVAETRRDRAIGMRWHPVRCRAPAIDLPNHRPPGLAVGRKPPKLPGCRSSKSLAAAAWESPMSAPSSG